jgi:DNA-directed RNA polymerase subunit RPC12/RpoP
VGSSENQRIRSEFVSREVLACFSSEMDLLLKAGAEAAGDDYPQYEDVENLYTYKCPNCGRDGFKNDDETKCPDCKKIVSPENEQQEIFEWWAVSKWLGEKLKAKNEPILDYGCNTYWGRCTTGQAIAMDGVIANICTDLGILK